MNESRRIYLHALTPVHSGTGQSAAIVDLPIAREKATGWPVLPGSGLKGVLRARCLLSRGEEAAKALFGSADRAGAVTLTDMRILCLPVRSFFGTFAWVTSPLALHRFARDAKALGKPVDSTLPPAEAVALAAGPDILDGARSKICLEDLDMDARVSPEARAVAEKIGAELFGDGDTTLAERFVIVPDNVFNFLCETATEVIGRTAIEDSTGTAKDGSLRYEEAVPAEAIFCGWAVAARPDNATDAWEFLATVGTLQLGGGTTIGRGLCRLAVQ
ncbi:MAG TPA: type III-B CRISPR module RAMP protein Cmr4 [Chthonomonadaceae bacterium]|nr:type III-B CRISPR module RAMP protein Cmr4 [Chthonomonadaceae bacterium]